MHIISHFWGVRRDGLCMEPGTAFVRLLVVGRMPVKIEDIYILYEEASPDWASSNYSECKVSTRNLRISSEGAERSPRYRHNTLCIHAFYQTSERLAHTSAITTHNGRKSQRSASIVPNPFPVSHSGAKVRGGLFWFPLPNCIVMNFASERCANYSWLLHKAYLNGPFYEPI